MPAKKKRNRDEDDRPTKRQKTDGFNFVDHFLMTLSAPRGRGKSFLIASMLENDEFLKPFDWVVIASPSHEFNDDWDEFVEDMQRNEKIHFLTDVNVPNISKILEKQKDIAKAWNKERRALLRQFPTDRVKRRKINAMPAPRGLLILDDCVDSGVISYRNIIDHVAMRGRHYKLTVIACTQRITSISTAIRDNSDYFIFFDPYTIRELERFIEEFLSKGQISNLCNVLGDIFQKKHQFIFIDNHAPANRRLHVSDAKRFIEGDMDALILPTKVQQHPGDESRFAVKPA